MEFFLPDAVLVWTEPERRLESFRKTSQIVAIVVKNLGGAHLTSLCRPEAEIASPSSSVATIMDCRIANATWELIDYLLN